MKQYDEFNSMFESYVLKPARELLNYRNKPEEQDVLDDSQDRLEKICEYSKR